MSIKETDIKPLLRLHLRRDEGVRKFPYKDTVGKLSIGVGRNLDDVGLSDDEIEYLLNNDIDRHIAEANREWPWIKDTSAKVRLALYNMAFNLGIPRLKEFIKMIDALYKHDYARAAEHALDSKWAKQVGKRADRIAQLYLEASRGD